jgi:hypothetical protein
MTRTRNTTDKTKAQVPARAADIVREYGPFEDTDNVAGVTHDGRHVWAALGSRLVAFDPANGNVARTLDRTGDAGTAFDGKHLYQIAEARIDKIDPASGDVLASIPAPGGGSDSGLAWADGSLWVGQYRDRRWLPDRRAQLASGHWRRPGTLAGGEGLFRAHVRTACHGPRDNRGDRALCRRAAAPARSRLSNARSVGDSRRSCYSQLCARSPRLALTATFLRR